MTRLGRGAARVAGIAILAAAAAGCGYYAPPIRPDAGRDAPTVTEDTVEDAPTGEPRKETEEDGG